MDSPDQSFLDEYKPLHVPHAYDAKASLQDNVVYALAQLEHATASEVAVKLDEFEPDTDKGIHQKNAEEVLGHLYDKGLIKGNDDKDNRQYNLSKNTYAKLWQGRSFVLVSSDTVLVSLSNH